MPPPSSKTFLIFFCFSIFSKFLIFILSLPQPKTVIGNFFNYSKFFGFAFFDTAMIVGIFEQVLIILEFVSSVPFESRIQRIGFFPLML